MAQTKHEIHSLLAEAGSQPRHRFGQNFMIDGNLVRIVAEAGRIEAVDLVIEVGPGTGTLTEELIATDAQVVAVEIDKALAELLKTRFASSNNFRLIRGDALAGKHAVNEELLQLILGAKSRGQAVRLVANLPYNIASPLIVELLIAGVDLLAFTVQKEVADRLRAAPGSKDYGTLTIMTQLLSQVEILRTLPPQAFWPMPKIESALVRLVREDQLGDLASDFNSFIQKVFSARRKMLRNTVDPELLTRAGINPQSRPEEIAPSEFLHLFKSIQKTATDGKTDARR
jgi:16S rRNA (adenine1518-N6/adenine1519-N6)-dimethyltransferase